MESEVELFFLLLILAQRLLVLAQRLPVSILSTQKHPQASRHIPVPIIFSLFYHLSYQHTSSSIFLLLLAPNDSRLSPLCRFHRCPMGNDLILTSQSTFVWAIHSLSLNPAQTRLQQRIQNRSTTFSIPTADHMSHLPSSWSLSLNYRSCCTICSLTIAGLITTVRSIVNRLLE